MNKIKTFSAVILLVSASVCIFSACKKSEPEPVTTTAEQTSTTKNNGYTYNENFSLPNETPTKYVYVEPPVPTHKENKPSTTKAEDTTKKSSSVSVEENANGLNILSKTSPVIKGNNASVIIMGTPNAEYTVEFYEPSGKKAAYSGLDSTKADSSGIASWSFTIDLNCESGEGKVIIREKNSDKYIQTSITVV